MAERLYLIRINLESFLGPMTADDVRAAYKKMQFGLHDEIAASNRDWIAFDDLARLRATYPELVEIVKKEMLSGWGKTEAYVSKSDKEPLYVSPSRSPRSNQSWVRHIILAAVLALVGGGTFWIVQSSGQLASRVNELSDPLLDKANDELATGNLERFDGFIEKSLPQILDSMNKRRGAPDNWLPYLRTYAFRHEGKVDGVDMKLLRGNARASAPRDCSLESWRQRWKASVGEWDPFLKSKQIPNKEWAKVLVWDPYWIRYRSPQKGWIDPSSYYEGCLTMALKALQQSDIEPTHTERKAVLIARLQWMLQQIGDDLTGADYSMAGGLWVLSCMESARQQDEVQKCQSSVALEEDWLRLIQSRAVMARIRIIVNGKNIKPTQMPAFQQLVNDVKAIDPITGFEYVSEQKFLQQVIVNDGKVNQARNVIRSRIPDFHFE